MNTIVEKVSQFNDARRKYWKRRELEQRIADNVQEQQYALDQAEQYRMQVRKLEAERAILRHELAML